MTDPAEDAHLTPVTRELTHRGLDHVVFDPGTFPYNATVTAVGGDAEVRYRVSTQSREFDFADVSAVWYRRPADVRLDAKLSPAQAEWLRTECGHLLRPMWAMSEACWVSDPDRIRRASLKLVQLDMARRLGFTVPAFIVTNDVTRASEFLRAHTAVVKVLARPAMADESGAVTFFTHVVTEADQGELDSVAFGPTLLQEFVPKRCDVRVTVFGRELFAVAIESNDLADTGIDFRRADTYDLTHRPIALPPALTDACHALVGGLGLRFGAIDLLCTPEGEYVFLEINPNGQWYWIEWMTGLPMTRALCDLLAPQSASPARG